jgi:hypothetical protein
MTREHLSQALRKFSQIPSDVTPRLQGRDPWAQFIMLCSITMAIAVFLLGGCTSRALQRSTITVSSSVGAILEQQVLENLGRFYGAPYSMPSQVVLSQGVVQVQNQLTSTLKLPYTLTQKNSKEGDLGLNMQWQETWTIVPVTDSEDLYRLQYLYQGAVNNLLPPAQRPTLHQEFLAFDVGPIHLGGSFPKIDCKATEDNSATKQSSGDNSQQPSRFENCAEIAKLLQNSKDWLAIDLEPAQSESEESKYKADAFVYRNVYARHRIWVRPKEFSQFLLYVLFATPKSKADSSTKGLSLAIQ